MAERTSTYSRIISPKEYSEIMTKQHVYIAASDRVIAELISQYKGDHMAEVVEFGCGPARALQQVAKNTMGIHLTGVDHDVEFLDYAKKLVKELELDVDFVQADITDWVPEKPIDIFYSQGVHHHIAKGDDLKSYLSSVHSMLAVDGYYILSDEFLPEYNDEAGRKINAIIWYAHVIAAARRSGYTYLAQEEAKTLLDDLYEETDSEAVKSQEQIELVLSVVDAIDRSARSNDFNLAKSQATSFLKELSEVRTEEASGDETVDLSRGDYKICDSVFQKEVRENGFQVIERKTVGPVDTIGGMAVYVLKKV